MWRVKRWTWPQICRLATKEADIEFLNFCWRGLDRCWHVILITGNFKLRYTGIEFWCYIHVPVYKYFRFFFILHSGQSLKMMFYLIILITVLVLFELGDGEMATIIVVRLSIIHSSGMGRTVLYMHVIICIYCIMYICVKNMD